MGGGVVKLDLRVATMRQYPLTAGQHCPHWHLTAIRRTPGFFERQGHAALIPFAETHSGASL